MTARANTLTDRVTKPTGDTGWTWSAPATDLRAMMNALGRLGYDADSLLGSVGLRSSDLSDPDGRIPCEKYGSILSRAQKERFTPNLALELARLTPVGTYPLLDYLVLTSDTVGAGVHQLAHYFRLIGGPAEITVREGVDPIRVEVSATAAPFTVEFNATLLVLHFRTETDGRFAAAHVSFRHTPDDALGFERALGCPVQSNASWNGVSVPLEAWRLPLRRGDPVLRRVLESQANDVLARLPARMGLACDVQRALTRRVTGGDTRIEAVARQLATSGRTLQRRLAAESVSYQELLDEARKEAAGRHLSESTLAIGEVAYLVGYSEPAPFHRAFKRWYGMTPEVFRRKQREGRQAAKV
jgi:AraC-like DNA-binding protein